MKTIYYTLLCFAAYVIISFRTRLATGTNEPAVDSFGRFTDMWKLNVFLLYFQKENKSIVKIEK